MITQKLALSYISKIAIQFVQMIAMFVVARIVGPGVMGTIAFGLAFVSMFAFISDLGLGSAHIKLISEGKDESECIGTFAVLKTILVGLYAAVTAGYYFTQKYILNIPFESREHEIVILIYLAITTLTSFFFIPSTTFAARTEQAKQDLPSFLQTLIYQILRVIAAVIGLKAIGLSLSNLAAVILIIPVYYFLFRGFKIGKYNKELAKKYFQISIPVLAVIIAQTIIYSTDRVILQYLSNSEEVGYYSAGFGISQFIRLIESSVGILFFPLFSNLLSINEFDKINAGVRKYERFNIIFTLPAVAAVSVCSDLVVKLALGPKFINTIPVLGFINISMFVSILFLPYLNLISGKGLFKLSAKIHIYNTFIYIASAFILVYPGFLNLRGIGIASSLIIVNFTIGISFVYYVRKHIPDVKILGELKSFIAGIILSAVFLIVYKLIPGTVTWHIIAAAGYMTIYFGGGYLTGFIRKDDINMLKDLINARKMMNYIKDEVKKQ
jgi:O-antigen/teichoic acid export membrane protein